VQSLPQRFLMKRQMSSTATTSDDHFGTALGYLMFGVAAGLGLDLCAKALLANYSLEQFVFLRSLFGILFFLIASHWYGGIDSLKTGRPGWHLLRTTLSTGAMFGFFFGLSRMPLVNALTIAFMAPLVVTGLSQPFLGEHVGWRRWLAVITGFAGVVIVRRPGEGMFTPAAIAVIIAAFCWAGLALTARKLATTESTFSLSFYVVMGPMLVAIIALPGKFVAPTPADWWLFVLAGLCSALAWIGIVGGYRRAPPVILAPFEYTALIGAAIAGYLIWDEVPDQWVVTGALMIIASGIYIVFREVGSVSASRYLRVFSAAGVVAGLRRLRQFRK